MKPTDALKENGFYWVDTQIGRWVVLEWRDGWFHGARNYNGATVDLLVREGKMRVVGPLVPPMSDLMKGDEMLAYKEEQGDDV